MQNRIRMVEPETIDMELTREINQVPCEKMETLRMIEIDHRAPGCITIEKALARRVPKNVIDVARVVEHNIEQHGQSVLMARVYQLLQRIWPAVRSLDGIKKRRV